VVEGIDEVLALVGAGVAPVLTEHQPGGKFGVEVRQQIGADQLLDLGGILAVAVAVLVERLQHPLGGLLHHLGRARAGGRRARGLGEGGRAAEPQGR
jgi:hypothetical protein